jgi:RNA-directed DNA polymerase
LHYLLLKSAKTTRELAALLGYSKASSLTGIVYDHSHLGNRYTSFDIPKKSGGIRTIDAPNAHLKLLQHRISILLQDCISIIEKNNGIENKIVHGFKRKLSILTNASCHTNKKYVLNLDIEDFFGSINFGRVRGYFISNKYFRLDPKIATILAQIACYNNGLPQGSPCSPVISNLIFQSTDIKLLNFSKKNNLIYTRYADDLTFSSNEKISKKIISEIILIIEGDNNKKNFYVNDAKTRLQEKFFRQSVTGLTVNKKVSVSKKYFRNARAAVENYIRNGSFEILDEKDNVNKLDGVLSFIYHVDQFEKNRLSHNLNGSEISSFLRTLNSREKLYRDFFVYDYFFKNQTPLVIGEGKTDSIYLMHAMKKMYINDPRFFEKKDGLYTSKIKFFQWNKKVNHLLGVEGGGGTLSNFITGLKAIFNSSSRFKSIDFKKIRPIVFLVDTDNSGIKALRSLSSVSIDVNDIKSSYIAKDVKSVITVSTKKDMDIEDLFHKDIKDFKLNGATFELYAKPNQKSYTKIVFAQQVVKKHAEPKHMKKFSPLFEEIYKAFN